MRWSLLLGLLAATGCADDPRPAVAHIGDPDRGRDLVREYGCHTCHAIPGVAGANATVGPPLERFKVRAYAGGRLNTPANLIEFLLDPRAVDHQTPMPSVGLGRRDAADVAAFLYTLR